MENNLYSLLIGINDYKGHDLAQCVADVQKMNDYLKKLDQKKFKSHDPVLLLDNNATKKNVVNNITTTLESLKDDDVFLLYYSGHGTQETSNDRFIDDHNGRIQCMVCHPEGDLKDALLADKELRYLFSKLKTKAHVITIFDCCHSGEITRSAKKNEAIKQERRMAIPFGPRPVENFIFSEEVDFDKFKTTRFNEVFPNKNIITLSASASHESSWEDRDGGVFTRNLLEVLQEKNNALNYNDIAKLTRLSIQSNTQEKQTPTIDVAGDQHFNQITSWLNLHGERFYSSPGTITYNKSEGWLYTKGSLHGVQESDTIKVIASSGEAMSIEIGSVKINHSTLDIPQSQMGDLDKEKSYTVVDYQLLHKPKIFVNDLDDESEIKKALETIVQENEYADLASDPSEADFDLNIFNHLVYFSFDNDAYRPLNEFYSLIDTDHVVSRSSSNKSDEKMLEDLKKNINTDLPKIQKWHHYSELEIKDEFEDLPIDVELSLDDGNTWRSIINGQIVLEADGRSDFGRSSKYKKLLGRRYKIRITNLTEDRLYVTPVILFNGKLEIDYAPKENQSIELDAEKEVILKQKIFMDHYMEVYNWEQECANYKFIVNNHSDMKTELPSILQKGLTEPLSLRPRGATRGGGSDDYEYQERNAIFSSKVIIKNSSLNQISGELAEKQDAYMQDEKLSPFVQSLYFDIDPESLNVQLIEKPNNDQAQQRSFKVFLGNSIDHFRRKRKFKRLLKKFPDKPIIVAEGDSWFLYPILVEDTLDHLMKEYPVKSLAWAGDTLANYKKSGSLIKEVEDLKPKYVMISGGGNDIVGPDIVHILEDGVSSGQEVSKYLNSNYEGRMKELKELYEFFFTEISKSTSVNKILVHGYDYVRGDHATIVVKGGWVSKYMIDKGIKDGEDRQRIIDFLINEFNAMLKKLETVYPKVTYVNLLNTVKRDEWYDEIHPNDFGYEKVANKFKIHLT